MNKQHITPRVIELAKKLYEAGYRQEIQEGDWYLDRSLMDRLICSDQNLTQENQTKDFIPIPSLIQALDWLEEKGLIEFYFLKCKREEKHNWILRADLYPEIKAQSKLEACLSAMLKVMGKEE